MPIAQATSPLKAEIEIRINGSPLTEEQQSHLLEVLVDLDATIPSMFRITLAGSASRANDLDWMADANFDLGKEVEIQVGYGDRLEKIIVGEITGLEPEFVNSRPPSLTIRGYDRRHRLLRGQKTRTFVKLKDSEIVQQIASDAGLTVKTKDSQVTHEYMIQMNQTDLAFLQERAALIDYEIIVQEKTLSFQPIATDATETISFSLEGDQLLSFYPRMSSMQQVSKTKLTAWDTLQKKTFTAQGNPADIRSKMQGQDNGAKLVNQSFGNAIGNLVTCPVASQAEADQRVKAQLNQQVLNLILGEGSCLGRTDLKPGQIIQFQNIGKKFSGNYYVTGVTHRYRSDRPFITDFRVKRNSI